MAQKEFIQGLKQEVGIRIKKKIITTEQSNKILKMYAVNGQQESFFFIKTFSLFAIVSIILGSVVCANLEWGRLNEILQLLIVATLFVFVGATIYLFVKRKELHSGFVLLRVVSLIVGGLLVIVNNFLDFQVPYYAIFLIWFVCLTPFVWIYKFKFFYLLALVVLHLGVFLGTFFYFPGIAFPLGLLISLSIGAILTNITKILRVSQKYSDFKTDLRYYDLGYFFGIIEMVGAYLLLSFSPVFGSLGAGISTLFVSGKAQAIVFYLIALLPLLSSVAIHITYYLRRKARYEEKKKKLAGLTNDFKTLVKDELVSTIHNFGIFVITLLFFFMQGNLIGLGLSVFINLWAVLFLCYLMYEGILIKIIKLSNISMLGILLFVLLKYGSKFHGEVSSATFFVIGALIFLLGGYVLEQGRKFVVQKLRSRVIVDAVDYDY